MTDGLALIGLEWSGTRLSAWAFDSEGDILSAAVLHEPRRPAGNEFIARTRFHLNEWLGAWPEVSVIACGDIGIVTGNAAGLTLPFTLSSLQDALVQAEGLTLVPWIGQRAPADLTCGAETILMGLDEDHAAVCIAGRHTRHVRMEHGRITRLSTEITAELRDLLLASGTLSLANAPPQAFDSGAFREWMESALDSEGALSPFAVEAAILTGQLDPAHKSAALTGLLIGADVAAHYDPGDEVLLVADGPLMEAYGLAFDVLGADVDEISATGALQDGLFELADLAGLLGED